MNYLIESYGCQMNIAESNAIELLLKEEGLIKTDDSEKADVVIINTCSVRKSAENRIWGRLGFYSALKKKKKLLLILTGCMAERLKNEIKKEAPYIDLVIGTNEKSEIANFISNKTKEKKEKYEFLTSYYKEGDITSYVPIMNGCNNFCSYCIVPYVRGREISRSVNDILNEIFFLEEKKVKEIVLLGQNVNSYKYKYNENDITFPDLLELIIPKLKSISFVRFESPHPKDFSDHLISLINKEEKLCKHIHLPLQSGSSKILKLMNRKTSREEFINLVDKMRSKIPNLTFSTDVMVGFPEENEKDFNETLTAMDYLNPSEAFMYYYNPREGTKAYNMPNQIDQNEKLRRLDILINEQLERQKVQKKQKEKNNTSIKVLLLGKSRDDESRLLARDEHNDYYSVLPNKNHKIGEIIIVKIKGVKGNTFLAEEDE